MYRSLIGYTMYSQLHAHCQNNIRNKIILKSIKLFVEFAHSGRVVNANFARLYILWLAKAVGMLELKR